MSEPVELTVREDEAGERLDRVLAARDLGHSRAALQRWMSQGRITVDGAPTAKDARARAGSVVRIEPAAPEPSSAEPQDLPLDILYRDDHLLVVNKAAGMVVHPAAGHTHGTLVNAVLHHARVELGPDPMRPGVVHRLDKDTSGVMVVALTTVAREGLSARFAEHDIERVYQAICTGHPPTQQTHSTLHGRHPVDRKRFSSKVTRGKRAVTHVRRLSTLHGAALVACTLETGRTHQIRVHMADSGHPLLGDPVYGGRPRDPRVKAAAQALGRQALHAGVLGFAHPVDGRALRFEAPPPPDFERALLDLAE